MRAHALVSVIEGSRVASIRNPGLHDEPLCEVGKGEGLEAGYTLAGHGLFDVGVGEA